MALETHIKTFEGNTRDIHFRLKLKGTKDFWDVSGADKIQLEWQRTCGDEAAQTPVEADQGHADADWADGLVVVTIGPSDVTALVGTVNYSLSVFFAGAGAEEVTALVGQIEVAERFGYPTL